MRHKPLLIARQNYNLLKNSEAALRERKSLSLLICLIRIPNLGTLKVEEIEAFASGKFRFRSDNYRRA